MWAGKRDQLEDQARCKKGEERRERTFRADVDDEHAVLVGAIDNLADHIARSDTPEVVGGEGNAADVDCIGLHGDGGGEVGEEDGVTDLGGVGVDVGHGDGAGRRKNERRRGEEGRWREEGGKEGEKKRRPAGLDCVRGPCSWNYALPPALLCVRDRAR